MLRLLKRVTLSLVVLTALAIAILYIWSSLLLNRKYDVPFTTLDVPTDSASIREGSRLIYIEHCRDCHGVDFTGRSFATIEGTAEFVGPNLTSVIGTYSNEELERVIRHGVRKNGTSVFFMPSNMYYELSDEGVGKIIAYLRTLKPKPSPADLPNTSVLYPKGRLQIILGNFPPRVSLINHTAPRHVVNQDTSRVALGLYLAMCACSGCHGNDLKGIGDRPNLVVATAYTKEQFFHLIRTGEGSLGRKELGLMSEIARNHLSFLNDSEIEALYAFCKTLPFRKD